MSPLMTTEFEETGNGRRPRLDEDVDVNIGRNIRARRRARGLTILELAALSDLTVQQVQRCESGKARITVVLLLRISEALGVDVLSLLPVQAAQACDSAPPEHREATRQAASEVIPSPAHPASARDLVLALAAYLAR